MNSNQGEEGRSSKPRNTRIGTAVLILVIGLAGCVDIKVRAGQPINIDGLDSLKVGVSTSDDVRLLIGSPFGVGRSQLVMQEKPVEMWSYYYELGTMSDDRRTFLFVYLDDGIYDGHMWFSSLPETLK